MGGDAWIVNWVVVGGVGLGSFAIAPATPAQINPDNTLQTPSIVAPGCTICTIEGGVTQGDNLFHSFSEFSIPNGGEAFFNNTLQIENIFSRVTGNSISDIDGLIRANGGANLFLINPNGIVFGLNAQLDIGGSFLASTADAIQFEDQVFFNASKPEASPFLTMSTPVGLQYGEQPIGTIANAGILAVEPSESLVLVGGDITLESGRLLALGGRVELGGLASAGTIGLAHDDGVIRLSFPDQISRGDVSLVNDARVDVTADNRGDIMIHAQDVSIVGERAGLLAGIDFFSGTPDSQAGEITINAIGAVRIEQGDLFNEVLLGASGNGGNINITASSLQLLDGGQINAASRSQGNTGKITIDVQDEVLISGVSSRGFPLPSGVNSTVVQGGKGDSGGIDITVREGSLRVIDGGVISPTVVGAGVAGDVNIQVRDSVILDGVNALGFPSAIGSVVQVGAIGQGGNIAITAGTVAILNGANLAVRTSGIGNAGTITIEAHDAVILDGPDIIVIDETSGEERVGGIFADVRTSTIFPNSPPAEGGGGDINIITDSLSIIDGATIEASTSSKGDAGEIDIQARDLLIQGRSAGGTLSSGIYSAVQVGGEGQGGEITVAAESLQVIEGGVISTAAIGQGNAGDIRLFVGDSIFLTGEGSGLFANVSEDIANEGGNIVVDPSRTPNRIRIQDGARIAVDNQGAGEGGDIRLITNSLLLEDDASISAETASNTGGNIVLDVNDLLLLRRGSRISTNAGIAQAGGDGGDITIDTQDGFIVAVPEENSDITANAFRGRGGNVNITARGIFGIEPREELTELSDITASSEFGISGSIQINNPDVDPSQGLTELPATVVDVSRLVAQGCDQPSTAAQDTRGEFYNTGRGGIINPPTAVLGSNDILEDLQPPSTWQANAPINGPIQEAQGWLINAAGQVMLVAEPPRLSSQRRCWR